MDKLMDNPWFIKIIALLLALLLYSSVPHTNGSKITDVNVPAEQTTETIANIPVKVYYDTDNLIVTGIPNTVDMTLKGPVTLVQSAKALKNFEVYVDLTHAKIGNQTVRLKVKNLSDKLQATIAPEYADVSIQEKVTKEFRVDAEYNSNLVDDGYTAGQPVVEPNTVKITGAKNVIDKITYVKATVDLKDHINNTVTKDAQVSVLDRDLNKLDVMVNPQKVKVTIPVKNTSKLVPINIVQKGTPPSGVSIDSITLDNTEATITGSEDLLKATDHVRVEVDVSKITDNTTLTLPVIIPYGISSVTPQLAKATVVVKKQGQKTVSGLPLTIHGLSSNYQAKIDDPVNQMINLSVSGPSPAVSALTINDFKAFIDLSSLTEGDHQVQIQVQGPPDVNWTPDKTTATVTISKTA